MRKIILGLALASYVGAAAAGELDRADAASSDNDYSATAYYRLDFGGPAASSQSVGLRFDDRLAAARRAPAAFQLSLDTSGVTSVQLRGVTLGGAALAANEGEQKKAWWQRLSVGEWIAIGFTGVVFIAAVGQGGGNDNAGATGTGGS